MFFYETKQTLFQLVFRTLGIIGLIIGGTFFGIYVLSQLSQQSTLDIFEILFEDFEILKNYLGEILSTFLVELPKLEIAASLVAFTISFILIFSVFKNFPRLKNKIHCLLKFWFKPLKPRSAG